MVVSAELARTARGVLELVLLPAQDSGPGLDRPVLVLAVSLGARWEGLLPIPQLLELVGRLPPRRGCHRARDGASPRPALLLQRAGGTHKVWISGVRGQHTVRSVEILAVIRVFTGEPSCRGAPVHAAILDWTVQGHLNFDLCPGCHESGQGHRYGLSLRIRDAQDSARVALGWHRNLHGHVRRRPSVDPHRYPVARRLHPAQNPAPRSNELDALQHATASLLPLVG
mmetsp:Transcript_88710/g.237273  ORF Transcript_88710/g.237273 Transcript_88710/m.237273 type:complete len:227 (+) Transcript_88710:545-1225(+)